MSEITKDDIDRWAEQLFLAGQEAIDKGICWSSYQYLIPILENIFQEAGIEVKDK